jgi:hypothetical protein
MQTLFKIFLTRERPCFKGGFVRGGDSVYGGLFRIPYRLNLPELAGELFLTKFFGFLLSLFSSLLRLILCLLYRVEVGKSFGGRNKWLRGS